MTADEGFPGSIQLPTDKADWIPLLKKIYEFESERVAGPGSYRRDIRQGLWTEDELLLEMSIPVSERKSFKALLGFMVKRRQVMQIQDDGNRPDRYRYITRVAETVRLLGHTYEYWYRGRPGVGAVRWLVEDKSVPSRTIPASRLISLLQQEIEQNIGSGDRTANLRKAVELVVRGVAQEHSSDGWQSASFSTFQLEASREMLLAQFKTSHRPKTQVLTAGVGSGKTIGFTLATLISAVDGIRGGDSARRSHLLIYPRKALAHGQFRQLQRYKEAIDAPQLRVHFEHADYYRGDLKFRSVKEGIEFVYGKPGPPPDIIVTTFETLKRRLQHPMFVQKLASFLTRVVLDEVHLAEGLSGGHIAMLMSRLAAVASSRKVMWTAASATVASPDEHASKIFGVPAQDVRIVAPSTVDLATVGLVHHVFLRPSGLISNLGVLVNATSLLVHNRRDDLSIRGSDDKKRPKTLGFADNLDLLGRWNADLRENERTEDTKERPHPKVLNHRQWTARQTEVPYAARFHQPLQARIETEGGKGEQLEPVLTQFRGQNVCGKCMAGERLSLGIADRATLQALSHIAYRNPQRKEDSVRIYRLENEVFDQEMAEVGTLDKCPYLQAGACLWFPRGHAEPVEPIPETDSRYEWRDVARSTIHSSKKETESEELEEDLADIVFKESVLRVYGIPSGVKRIPVDVVLASPSLEVGVDLPMVTESIMTKAIRNVATYRQKAGRIGREPGLDVVNATLVTDTPIDLHYYRQPRKLVSQGRLDPIPMKDRNEAIVRSALYMAVWDWLAVHADLPEAIPVRINRDGQTDFSQRLVACRSQLTSRREQVLQHLSRVSRGLYTASSEWVTRAVEQSLNELDFLLRDASGTLSCAPPTPSLTVADAMVYLLAGRSGRSVTGRHPRQSIEPFYRAVRDLEGVLGTISPRTPLAKILGDVGESCRTGSWKEETVSRTLEALRSASQTPQDEEVQYNSNNLVERVLPSLLAGLTRVRVLGHDPLVFALQEQYRRLLLDSPWKAHYLSTIMQSLTCFDALRLGRWYTRPENLFSNPHEPQVRLNGAPSGNDQVGLGEALFGFLPGAWTYRFPFGCYKVKVGQLASEPRGELVATLEKMVEAGNRFELIRKGLPSPPGLAGTIDVYAPVTLSLQREYKKYVPVDWTKGVVLDRDEALSRDHSDSTEEDNKGQVIKVPRSFPSRWVHIESSRGSPVYPLPPDVGELSVAGNPPVKGEEALHAIRHPLFGRLIKGVDWHDVLTVTEYIYSVSRSYSRAGEEETELVYRDRFGNVAMGTVFETEGMSVSLNSETVDSVVSAIVQSLVTAERGWTPSLLKAFFAYISEPKVGNSRPPNVFLLNDIVAMIVTSAGAAKKVIAHKDLFDTWLSLTNKPDELQKGAVEYYSTRSSHRNLDPESTGGRLSKVSDKELEERTTRLVNAFQSIQMPESAEEDFKIFLEKWVRRTLLNTFGVVALTALQQFSGANDFDIGYSISPEAWEGGDPIVFLYDRAYYGNGSSSTGSRYLHIPNILRHGETERSRFLPSDDYLSTLEEKLLECPQFHTDLCALSRIQAPQDSQNSLLGLRDVAEQASEVFAVSHGVWARLGIRGPQDAWRLPIVNLCLDTHSAELGVDPDDLLRATTICWNGCPECVNRPDIVTGGLLGQHHVDKMVLDKWFLEGTRATEEYQTVDLRDIATGKVWLDIGLPHRLALDMSHRRLRSVQLPWTIGFHIDRGAEESRARLVMRVSDILDLRAGDPKSQGVAAGVESVGFKRLLWFDMILTAYLDVLGLLEDGRKEVALVYYDCRDISFDDVGLSSRMIDAVLSEARRAGIVHGLRNLSDILRWLLSRGFRVSLCVDRSRAEEPDVKSFLDLLTSLGAAGLRVTTKDVEHGAMHKKALVTPVGVLSGSANLTTSAASRNEEILIHFFYGTSGYGQLKSNVMDTFVGADTWGGSLGPLGRVTL